MHLNIWIKPKILEKNIQSLCKIRKERKMSAETENSAYPPTDGAAPATDISDVEMVVGPDSSGAKSTRNVQTQHGDQSVDAENIFLIPRCLWPEKDETESTWKASTSADIAMEAPEEEPEQVVWIEPFADEVCSPPKHLLI